MELKYDLFDILNIAIMSKKSIVIVEGKDDYQIYQNLINGLKFQIQVYQVNEFADYGPGCSGVIQCIEKLQPKFEERTENIKCILGIIDRDARFFRKEVPTHLKGLFITKFYSIETYFATKPNLRNLLSKITYNTSADIEDSTLEFLELEFNNSLPDLFFISLEALKNACTKDYDTVIGYDDSENKVNETGSRKHIMTLLEKKKVALETFAESLNITIDDVKLVAKGKWYLFGFAYYIHKKICELKNACNKNVISQCRSCRVGNNEECLYKLRNSYRPDLLRDELLNFIDLNEFSDIVDALNILHR